MAKKIKKEAKNVNVQKKKGGCLKNSLFIILGLTAIGLFLPKGEKNEPTKPLEPSTELTKIVETEEKTTVKMEETSVTTESEVTETTQGQDTFGEPKSEVNYDINEINGKIWDSLEESKKFAETDPDYTYHAFIDTLEVQQTGALHVVVTDEFNSLSEEDKKTVLQTANNIAKLEIFMQTNEDNPLFITALNMAGEKIAQSKMTNFTEYTFK